MSATLRQIRSLGRTYRVASALYPRRPAAAAATASLDVSRGMSSSESDKPHSITGGSYDGPGKTTVDILNTSTKVVMVDSYSTNGFRLNNLMKVYGPIAVFPTSVLAWLVTGPMGITLDSLSLFRIVHPKPEVIFVGYGGRGEPHEIRSVMEMNRMGYNVQIMPTEDAISSYNYLALEDRLVAAALIPPDHLSRFRTEDLDEHVKRVSMSKGETQYDFDYDAELAKNWPTSIYDKPKKGGW